MKSSTTLKNIIYVAPATGIVCEPHKFRAGHYRMGLPMAEAGGLNYRKRKMARNEVVVTSEADLLAKLAEGFSLRMRPVAGQRTRDDQPVRRKARMVPSQSIMVDGKALWQKTANGEADKAKAKKEQALKAQAAKKAAPTKGKKPAPKPKKGVGAFAGLEAFKPEGQQKAA